MRTQKTGKREAFLEDRQLERERYKPDIIRTVDHIRAELDRLARRVRKVITPGIGQRMVLNDVLAIIKELRK